MTHRFTEEAARFLLGAVRWNDGAPQCPRCDYVGETRWIRTRNVHRCRKCNKQFTVTSGTVFANHKLPLSDIVFALLFFEERGMETPALHLAKELGVSYKCALILKRKIGEGRMSPRGILAEPSYLSRWYWQGYNFWHVNENGELVRTNKHGHKRLAYFKALRTEVIDKHPNIIEALGDD